MSRQAQYDKFKNEMAGVWECECPMCGKIYTKRLEHGWTGQQLNSDGTVYRPRKNCERCKLAIDNIGDISVCPESVEYIEKW